MPTYTQQIGRHGGIVRACSRSWCRALPGEQHAPSCVAMDEPVASEARTMVMKHDIATRYERMRDAVWFKEAYGPPVASRSAFVLPDETGKRWTEPAPTPTDDGVPGNDGHRAWERHLLEAAREQNRRWVERMRDAAQQKPATVPDWQEKAKAMGWKSTDLIARFRDCPVCDRVVRNAWESEGKTWRCDSCMRAEVERAQPEGK